RARRLTSMTPSYPTGSSFLSTHSSSAYPPHGVSVGLWSFLHSGDGHIDRDLGDVGGVPGRPCEAVHDGRQGQQLLPLLLRDMVGQTVNQLLMPVQVVHRLVRGIHIRRQ